MNISLFIAGSLLAIAGAAGMAWSNHMGNPGPVVDWFRDRMPHRTVVEGGEGRTAFAFAGRVRIGSSVWHRLLSLFWIIVMIGVVAAVLALSMYQLGTLINSTVRRFVTS